VPNPAIPSRNGALIYNPIFYIKTTPALAFSPQRCNHSVPHTAKD